MRHRLDDDTTQRIQDILEIPDNMSLHYTVVKEPGSSDEEVSLFAIHDERKLCFFIAISHTHVEEASAICAQAVLHRSTPNDGLLYYAVYDVLTQMVYFCLCDPQEETYEDVDKHCLQSPASRVEDWLRSCVLLNAQALGGGEEVMGTQQSRWEDWALSTKILSPVQNTGATAVHITSQCHRAGY
jgi:hypothetical protein